MLSKIITKLTIVSLLLVMGLLTNYELFYYMLFTLNRDALTAEFCEKKTETCKACCYLDKQLQKETGENYPVLPEKGKKNNELKIQEYFLSAYNHLENDTPHISSYIKYHSYIFTEHQSDIFHPPKI